MALVGNSALRAAIGNTIVKPRGPHVACCEFLVRWKPNFTPMVLWCSWLSLLSNTQAVPGSNPGGIIYFAPSKVQSVFLPVLRVCSYTLVFPKGERWKRRIFLGRGFGVRKHNTWPYQKGTAGHVLGATSIAHH